MSGASLPCGVWGFSGDGDPDPSRRGGWRGGDSVLASGSRTEEGISLCGSVLRKLAHSNPNHKPRVSGSVSVKET